MSPSADDIQSNREIERLEETIIVLEAQRAQLGDVVVDTAVAPLREKLAAEQMRQSAATQQRKFVTILFADMTGWTALSQKLQLEDMMALTDGAIGRFKRIIERRGGRVLKFMGDGLMAVFGIPEPQENDAERAVQAGLDVLAGAKIYGQILEETWGLKGFNVRVGLNTGPIIMGGGLEDERTAIGMTVNIAARMEAHAPVGTMRITHATYQQIRGMFEVEPQPLLRVKGRDQPMVTYLVARRRQRSFHMGRHGIKGINTPFIGRQHEFELLLTAFKDTVRDQAANMVTIVGDPGIGKSRLLKEFETWLAQQPALVHTFHGRGFQSIQESPFSLLRMLIAHYCQIQENDELEAVHRKLGRRLSTFFEEDALLKTHFIGALLGYNLDESPYLKRILNDPKEINARALHYLEQLFSQATSNGLTVILLEDIQWADDPTLEFIKRVATACAGQPLLLVCLSRPELIRRHQGWFEKPGKEDYKHQRLDLAPLSIESSQLLVVEILKQAGEVPETLVETIVSQSDGNPYYIEELVNMLLDGGVINRHGDDERWFVDMSKFKNTGVPDTLTAVMLSRLDTLAPAEKGFLQRASVAGRSFWGSLVNAISGHAIVQEDILSSLVKHDLIIPAEVSTITGEEEFVFKSSLLRDAVYETILLGDRRVYHGRIADWLKSVTTETSGREDEFALVIAEHYDLAEMPGKAAGYYLRAGEKAKNQGVPTEALRSLERALLLMGHENSDRWWKAMTAKATVLGWLGKSEEQLAVSRTLVREAKKEGKDDRLADAYIRLGFSARWLGRYQDEAQAYQTAIEAAQRAGNRRVEAMSLALLAVCLLRLDQRNEAESAARNALSLAVDLDDALRKANTLTNVAHYYSDAGDIAKAVRLLKESVEICDEIGIQYTATANRLNLGYNYILLGIPDLAAETLEEATRMTQAIGVDYYYAYCQLNLGLAYLRLGEQERAQLTLERAFSAMETFRDQFGIASSNLYLGLCLEQGGELPAALDRFKQARSLFVAAGTTGHANDASAGIARCLLAMNELDGAENEVEEIWEYLTETGSGGMEFPGLAFLTCIDIFAARGQSDRARAVVNAGYVDLMERAEKIGDEAWHRSFLHNVIEHQALIDRQKELPQALDLVSADGLAGRRKTK